jgi:amidase
MSEWASAGSSKLESGFSPRGGLTGNPFALDRSADQSSSGSAAGVAAGLAPFALGTETIGSLTMSASHCGVFAVKPTRGVLFTEGIAPFSPQQDVPGVFARSLDDLRTVLELLLGRALLDKSTPQLTFIEDNDLYDPEQSSQRVATTYEMAVMTMVDQGALTQALPAFPSDDFKTIMHVLQLELRAGLGTYVANRPGSLARSFDELIDEPSRSGEYEYTNDQFAEAASLGKAPLSRKVAERPFIAYLEEALDYGDVLIAPAYGPADKLDLTRRGRRPTLSYQSYLDGISSFAGWPTLTMPFIQEDGLPVGMVLVARPHCEAHLFAAALELTNAGVAGEFRRPTWHLPQRG